MSRKAISGAPRSVTIRVTEEIRDELKLIGKGDACAAIEALLKGPVVMQKAARPTLTPPISKAPGPTPSATVMRSMYIGKRF